MPLLLDTALEAVITTYIEANRSPSDQELGARRELRLARFALEEAAKQFVATLNSSSEPINSNDPDAVIAQMNRQAATYRACERLINLAKMVAGIAKACAEIEDLQIRRIDAAQVYSVVMQIPEIVRGTINSLTSDPDLAKNVTITLTEKIRTMSMLVDSRNQEPQGILEAQLVEMLNSVPGVSTVLAQP